MSFFHIFETFLFHSEWAQVRIEETKFNSFWFKTSIDREAKTLFRGYSNCFLDSFIFYKFIYTSCKVLYYIELGFFFISKILKTIIIIIIICSTPSSPTTFVIVSSKENSPAPMITNQAPGKIFPKINFTKFFVKWTFIRNEIFSLIWRIFCQFFRYRM